LPGLTGFRATPGRLLSLAGELLYLFPEAICTQHKPFIERFPDVSNQLLGKLSLKELAIDHKRCRAPLCALTAVARRFKRSPSTLSRAVENLRRKRKNT